MDEPVVILGVPRSGTSMVAGIFQKHGLWVGTCREPDAFNARGHFENLAIKNLMKRWWKGNACTNGGIEAEPRQGFRAEVEKLLREDGWKGERWMFKCAPVYWRLFDAEWKPTWVTVRRDAASIIHSNEVTGFVATIREVLNDHLQIMNRLEKEKSAARIDADGVVWGEYDELRAALSHAGLEMREEVVRAFVDPGLWGRT